METKDRMMDASVETGLMQFDNSNCRFSYDDNCPEMVEKGISRYIKKELDL